MAGKIQYIRKLQPGLCTYWPGKDIPSQQTAMVGVDLSKIGAPMVRASHLLRPAHLEGVKKGFMSMHFGVVAPTCPTCNACVPLRVNTEKFSLTPSQVKRMGKENLSFQLATTETFSTLEMFNLFKTYTASRHGEKISTMRSWDMKQFINWLDYVPFMLTMRHTKTGQLAGYSALNGDSECGVMEYIVFDPAYEKISPGKRLWLQTVMEMKAAKIQHVYVGSWAKGSPKLSYKEKHSGLETFDGEKWVDFDPEIHTQGPDYKAMIRREGFNF